MTGAELTALAGCALDLRCPFAVGASDPAIPADTYFSIAPDWVCEVLSPSTERIDRSRKLRIYAEAGIAHAWLVNPVERTLEVLRLREGAWTILAVLTGSDVVRAEPFDAIEIGLGDLWVDSTPPSGLARP
jgi:Uma2 family endonuclease